MADNFYKDDSIESLSPREHVRLRPGMYAGDTSDATQLAIEILGNSIDEYNIGHGDCIQIDINPDWLSLEIEEGEGDVVLIRDNGQGFPINVEREDGETVLQASFDIINTSGKYRDDGVYEGTAIGLNGIGAKLTNFLSHTLNVISFNSQGDYESIWFTEGVFQKRDIGKAQHLAGTEVVFVPSGEFFDSPTINQKKLKDFCEDITCLCPGLTIIFNKKVIKHDNGVEDLLLKHLKTSDIELTSNRLIAERQEGKQKVFFGLTYTANSNSIFIPYVNCGLTSAGPHITAIKTTLTRILNKWAREQGLLKEKDKNLDGNSLQEGLIFVANITAENVAYNAQVKSNITKINTTFITTAIGKELEIWLDNNPSDGKVIIEKALVAYKASEAARKAREAVKNKNATKHGKKKILPAKLADCSSKNRSECELYITEGDSASGGAKIIRNATFQAVLGLRGKILNCLTATSTQIAKNEEVVGIINALGFDYLATAKEFKVYYDESKIRYNKFIIAADKDPDGSHIQTLVLTLITTLIPELLINGHVYVALPPLYKAEWGTKYQYIQDRTELENFEKEHKGNYTLTYFKGLGEADPEELGNMIIDPKTRNIVQVTTSNFQECVKLIEDLMGKDSQPKKDFVFGGDN